MVPIASSNDLAEAGSGEDIVWLCDESMEDSASLPPPDEIAEEILEDLRAALEHKRFQADLAREPSSPGELRMTGGR